MLDWCCQDCKGIKNDTFCKNLLWSHSGSYILALWNYFLMNSVKYGLKVFVIFQFAHFNIEIFAVMCPYSTSTHTLPVYIWSCSLIWVWWLTWNTKDGTCLDELAIWNSKWRGRTGKLWHGTDQWKGSVLSTSEVSQAFSIPELSSLLTELLQNE